MAGFENTGHQLKPGRWLKTYRSEKLESVNNRVKLVKTVMLFVGIGRKFNFI